MSVTLTPAQQAAVERTGQDVCVVAGPGSGKTRVLVRRFAWLVEQGVPPLRILAITYTDRAAGEIKSRLVQEFSHHLAVQQQIERAYVSTVHGFCARLLRENAIAAELNPEFTIFDQRRSQAELSAATLEVLDELFRTRPAEVAQLLEGWAALNPVRSLEQIYQLLRVSGEPLNEAVLLRRETVDPRPAVTALLQSVEELLAATQDLRTEAQQRKREETRLWLEQARRLGDPPIVAGNFAVLREFAFDRRGIKREHPAYDLILAIKEQFIPAVLRVTVASYYAPQRELLAQALLLLHQRYQGRKKRRDALDFDDLQERTTRLLEQQPVVRQAIQESFDAILMDELQDTNPLQWKLLDLLRRPGQFFGVGDVNQSIYGFRHADPRVFTGYREQLRTAGHEIDRLAANYRSRAEILTVVDAILGQAHGIEPHTLEPQGTFLPKGEPSVEVTAALGADAEASSQIEAAWIAARIRELQGTLAVGRDGHPARFQDIAILVRTSDSLTAIEAALQEFHVPYLMNRGQTFFEEQEVVDVVNALRVLANGRDEISLLAVLRSPLVGVSDETILRLWRAGGLADSLERLDAVEAHSFDPEDWERLAAFRREYQSLRARLDEVLPDQLLQSLLDSSDYEAGLSPAARANVEKLLGLIRDLAAQGEATLPEVVSELNALREAQAEPNAPPLGPRDAVQVLTMHSAKGLEWPIVFLAALQKGTRNQPPALTYSPAHGLGALWRVPGEDKDPIGDPPHEQWVRETQAREAQEANRLFYVAMTRAEEHLVLSYAETRGGNRTWPNLLEIGLGLRLTGPQPPVLVQTPVGVPLRWQVVVRPRENSFGFAPGLEEPVEPQVVSPATPTTESPSHVVLSRALMFDVCPRRYALGEVFEPSTTSEVKSLEPVLQDPVLGTRLKNATEWGRDVALLIEWNGILVEGNIDLWWEEPDGRSVVVSLSGADRDAQLQAMLYARWRNGPPDELYRLSAGGPERLGMDLAAAKQFVAELVDAHQRYRYPARPGEHCTICSWANGICPDAMHDRQCPNAT